MPDSAEPQVRRYSAFISYSHMDAAVVRRLHRRLEAYRLPARLADAAAARRLKPLFRDDAELSAAPDLTAAVRTALADADFLIVVCSPQAAQSEWVAREIELFRALRGETRILTALIEGDRHEALPLPLRRGGGETEPVPADFRKGRGGERLALLKLVAPLAGVYLDDLVHRDGQRRVRQVASLAAGGLAGMATLGVLAAVAMSERSAAVQERAKAQALVGAMATDLRKDAKGVTGLGYLNKINAAAAGYFAGRDLAHMDDKALETRATLLHNMGEDAEKRDDLAGARRSFEEARRITGALLAKRPNDAQRIFDHAQSEYWVGFVDWRAGDVAGAKARFQAYADLATRLVAADPAKPEWRSEAGSAENNLGMLALRQAGDAAAAQRHFSAALASYVLARRSKPSDADATLDLADGYAWRADTERIQGDYDHALADRATQRSLLETLLKQGSRNAAVRENLAYGDLAVARIYADRRAWSLALRTLDHGRADAQALYDGDPQNGQLAKQVRAFDLFKVRTVLSMPAAERPRGFGAQAILGDCEPRSAALRDNELRDFCLVLLARAKSQDHDETAARRLLAGMKWTPGDEAYSPRWGLNFAAERRLALAAHS